MMLDFTKEETQLLVGQGFKIGWMGDIQDSDVVAIAPVMRTSFGGEPPKTVKTLLVERVQPVQSDYYDEEEDKKVRNVVIHFFGYDLDGLPEHCTYGSTYPCFIKRAEKTVDPDPMEL